MAKLLDDATGADIRGLVPGGPDGLRAVFARLLCSPSRADLLIRKQPDAPASAPVTTTAPGSAPVAV